MKRIFTSESVTIGHPDKICDQISDAILDSILLQDPSARVACDVAVNTGMVLVMGEITTECYVDINDIARSVIKDIGYTKSEYGFDGDSCAVLTSIDKQSPDISMGVSTSLEYKTTKDPLDLAGAGDQGMMFGYACRETEQLMPLPITLAHALTKRLAEDRFSGKYPYLRPDGKAQVSVEYDENNNPCAVSAVVLSTQHSEEVDYKTLTKDMTALIYEVVGKLITEKTTLLINPTGRFVVGGPRGDSGLTGRKIIVDTYGGLAPHGGGAFSGKDPTKVDRSAAYYARFMAKNIVAAGLADRCEVALAYAIGKANPVSIRIDTKGTGVLSDDEITAIAMQAFDPRPSNIIAELELTKPVYLQTAKNGHFGNPSFKWEQLSKVERLKELLKKAR